MKHLGGLIIAAAASFLGGLAVIFFQYYWWPAATPIVERGQVEITSNFEVRLDIGAVGELAGWFLPKDEIEQIVRKDGEISIFAYRLTNTGKKDISDIILQIHAEDYKGEFSIVHTAITDPFDGRYVIEGGGHDRWKHLPLKPSGSTATTNLDLLKPNETILLLIATSYNRAPEIDIRSDGVDLIALDDHAKEFAEPESEIDLTWLIVLAFGIGGLFLGLGLSEKVHRTALNSIGFDYDELTNLVKQETAKKSTDA